MDKPKIIYDHINKTIELENNPISGSDITMQQLFQYTKDTWDDNK